MRIPPVAALFLIFPLFALAQDDASTAESSDVQAAVPFQVNGSFQSPDDKPDTDDCADFEQDVARCKLLLNNGGAQIKLVIQLTVENDVINQIPEGWFYQSKRNSVDATVWTPLGCRASATEAGKKAEITCTNVKLEANARLWLACATNTKCTYSVRGEQ